MLYFMHHKIYFLQNDNTKVEEKQHIYKLSPYNLTEFMEKS